MSAEVGVLIIHGMGSQRSGFAEDSIRELTGRIVRAGKDPDQIAWEPVYWADTLDMRQREYLRNANRAADLDFKSLRKFIVTALGDAGAYQKVDSSSNETYEQIHARIAAAVHHLFEVGLDSKPKPLIILAHSLGCHIISNYIWDMQHGSGAGLPGFERMDRLA